MKKKSKLKGLTLAAKILFNITLVLCGVAVIGEPIMQSYSDVINGVLGIEVSTGGAVDKDAMYFNTKYTEKKIADVHKDSKDIIEETMAEGAVLLKNEGALPLAENDKVNLYGLASYYSVHVGQGSGGIENSALGDRVTLEQGLTAAGLEVNQTLNSWYKSQDANSIMGGSNFIGGSTQRSQYVVKDIAWDGLPNDAKRAEAKVGIMVLARNSGEATDLYMDTTMDDGTTRVVVDQYNEMSAGSSKGDSLALSVNEKSVLAGMKALKAEGRLEKIVVLMNSASPLMCDFIDDDAYGIDACMWVGTLGTTGANAVGKLLTGEYNPSGRTSDTFWANSKYNTVYYNFGDQLYGNDGILDNYVITINGGKSDSKYYVAYQEGIYNGYKYTETRYEDKILNSGNPGDYDYSKVVSYPFGYGLSYTNFTYSNMQVTENEDNTYTVSVDVTNNTKTYGKEVVQIYVQKPYTEKDVENGVEKPAVELVGFTKVEIEGEDTVTATVTVDEKYFAAYDANGEKTYVIGSENTADKYLLTAAKDAHDAVNNILQYKKESASAEFDDADLFVNAGRSAGDKDLVWGKHIAYNATKYSTNEFIESENKAFVAGYDGQKANYGVDKITNRFEDVDFTKSALFSEAEKSQKYMTRSNWTGTYGKRITLTATQALKEAQKNPEVKKHSIPYPTFGSDEFYVTDDTFDTLKLIYLRGKDYNDPLWQQLLDAITWDEMCAFLQTGFRVTNAITSIAAPSTAQQNGGLAPNHARTYNELTRQSGFQGFVDMLDSDNAGSKPPVFCCNGLVSSTYNIELIERIGEQTGEEAAWAGYNGIYGLGVNIHRGAYCGRTFEYYSEDGYLTGVAAGYEAVGLHKLGVFVLMKHAVLNDQETHRAGLNVWANEQSIREVYCRAMEVAIEIDRENTPKPVLGVMTGMNRMGAKWTGGHGFCNTVLRAEFGMRGFAVSDYNTSRCYMSPVQGVLYGNDLPDGNPASQKGGYDYNGNNIRFTSYSEGYGELAWAMRDATHKILYTVVNSNAMNGRTGNSEVQVITPQWQIMLPVVKRVVITVFVWCTVAFAALWLTGLIKDEIIRRKPEPAESEPEKDEVKQ